MKQTYIYRDYDSFLRPLVNRRILLVCGNSINNFEIKRYFSELTFFCFSDFSPNPEILSVVNGVRCYREKKCDAIVAIGGGSAIDVAKGIIHSLDERIPFFVMPTTAGTGSEATTFAVLYDNDEKISIADERCMPQTVLFDDSVLDYLPEYHLKSSMLDALCHGIESFWSINSTEESRKLAGEAIHSIVSNWKSFLERKQETKIQMFLAANCAGKAINITKTTAGHAMSYKLTKLYGISHGHAVALCIEKLWPFMLNHLDEVCDSRGRFFLEQTFLDIAQCMGCNSSFEAAKLFSEILHYMNFERVTILSEDVQMLTKAVNLDRLRNNPILLTLKDIEQLYLEMIGEEK